MQRFNTLVRRYQDTIYTFAHYYLGDAADAEDVTQEVLIRLWRHHKTLDLERISGWIMQVTRNACIDAYRKRKTYVQAVETDTEGLSYQQAAGTEPSPAQAAEASEFQEQLEQALNRLSEPYRSIVILREIQDLKYDQISETLDLPLNTVKVYLHRGRKMLREALRPLVQHDVHST